MAAASEALFGPTENESDSTEPDFDLAFATQGQEAVEVAREAVRKNEPFAMAFVDMRMPPGWDGLTTIENLWQVDPHILIVICTAYNDHGWQNMNDRLGRHDAWQVLKKPFDSIEVRQLAYSLTTKWALARAARLEQEELERIVEDRTNRAIKAQRALLRMNKHRAIGSLARGVAHQFNNYLQIVQGYTRFVMSSIAEGSQQYDDLQNVLEASDRAAELAAQLLAFSQDAHIAPIITHLDSFVSEFEFAIRSCVTTPYDVHIEAKSQATIYADQNRLREALLNLCLNAKEAMPAGGTVSIRTGVREIPLTDEHAERTAGSYAFVSVSDSGVGMPQEVLDRATEPFFTTKEVGEGVGLGLSTTAGLAHQLGGFLEIESEVGVGTTVSLYFPLDAEPPKQVLPELDIDELCGAMSAVHTAP